LPITEKLALAGTRARLEIERALTAPTRPSDPPVTVTVPREFADDVGRRVGAEHEIPVSGSNTG
jgi:hypothetical protein